MRSTQVFTITLARLPAVEDKPGLILLKVGTPDGSRSPRRVGTLSDVALRGRLAQYDLHSANEVAAIRKALHQDGGQAVVRESWSGLGSCLQFWHSFVGSQIRTVEWACESCAAPQREDVGANVGESFLKACRCGKVNRVTIASRLTPI
jgi:hypothetical protein